MINQKEITVEWLVQVSKKHRNIDKILVEKTIRALLLLEGLAKQNLDFVFKGGTALFLYFDSPKRLSLDIDIILSNEIENFETILDDIAENQGFLRKELHQRITQSKIKKEHYKFFFTPLHKTNKDEEYVLLDILYEKVNYKHLIFSESYHIEKAITHASKAAYVAMLIKHNANSFDKFDNLQQLKDLIINEPFNTKLNKLKKSNPEAFFYWYNIYELEK